jgi:transcriptional regulator with XRE-family HTH domain
MLKAWMKKKKLTQTALADMLGISQGTVNRWVKSVHAISGPEQKLLSYLMFGVLPFEVQTADQGWHLEFTEGEFAVIQLLARREGFDRVEEWIVAKIRAYLAMSGATGSNITSKAGDPEAIYKAKKL